MQYIKGESMIKEELKDYLKKQYENLFDDETIESDGEVAIYYFASDYHDGQSSDLYKILSQSEYKPGPLSTLRNEGEIAEMMYMDLVQKFEYQFCD